MDNAQPSNAPTRVKIGKSDAVLLSSALPPKVNRIKMTIILVAIDVYL